MRIFLWQAKSQNSNSSHWDVDYLPDPVSANSEKGRGSEWAVRVGQRLWSSPKNESGTSFRGSAGNLGGSAKYLVDTTCFCLELLAAFWWTIERGWPSEWRAINYEVLRRWHVLGSHENIARRSDGQPLFRDRWCHSRQDPKRALEAWRWLLVACFLSVKNHNVSGPHIFPSFTTHTKKIPLPILGRSYREQKNNFAIGHNSERCSYHTDLSRFVLPISDPSALNFSQIVGFQDSPNLSKIEKVAETCEFNGKEPLFVERTIAISIRVLHRCHRSVDYFLIDRSIGHGRYRRSIRIHLLENTVDIWSTVDFTQKLVEIDRRYGFIPKKIGRYRLSMCPQTKKNRSKVDIDRRSGNGLKKIVSIDLTHPYFITNRCKWFTCTLTSFHGDQFQALLTKQHTRKKQTHTDKV